MTRVHSFTSKVGYYTSRGKATIHEYYVSDGSFNRTYNGTPVTGVSYKSPTLGSDGHRPTHYSRIVLRGMGEPYRVVNAATTSLGSDAFFNWHSMAVRPWGQTGISSGQVAPSSYLRTEALAEAVRKMQGENANILEDLAQAGKTAKQVWDLVKDISRLTGKYLVVLYEAFAFWEAGFGVPGKRGGPKRHRRSKDGVLKRLAKAWLAWYYGIKPLINTITALGRSQKPRSLSIRVKASREAPLSPSGLFSHVNVPGRFTYSGKCKEETTVVLMVDCYLTSTLAALANLGFQGGGNPFGGDDSYGNLLNDGDILTLGWALLPYSFVFDWLVPVESFLSTLVWSPLITYQGGYITDYMGGVGKCQTNNGAAGYKGDMPKSRVEAHLSQRESYANYPPPSALGVKQGLLTSPQSLNLFALIVGAKG